jgi:hypothetical protein
MRVLLLVLFVAITSLLGCGSALEKYSDDGGRGSVRLLENGNYIVSYKWPYVENRYGRDRHSAIPAYLEENGLAPASCAHGVEILRGGEGEGGWGWAEFRCQ